MTQSITNGFDIAVNVLQMSMNDQLGELFQDNPILSGVSSLPVCLGTVSLHWHPPWVSFDPKSPGVNRIAVISATRDSTWDDTSGGGRDPFEFNARLTLEAELAVASPSDTERLVYIDFRRMAQADVDIALSRGTRESLRTTCNDEHIVDKVTAQLAVLIHKMLTTEVKTVDIQRLKVDPAKTDFFMPSDLAVRVVPKGAPNKSFLSFLLTTTGSPGNPEIDRSGIPHGNTMAMVVSNDLLLSGPVRKQLAAALELEVDDFDLPCRLKSAHTQDGVPYGTLTLETLVATVQDGYVAVDGSYTWQWTHEFLGVDYGITADGDFRKRIEIGFDHAAQDLSYRIHTSEHIVDLKPVPTPPPSVADKIRDDLLADVDNVLDRFLPSPRKVFKNLADLALRKDDKSDSLPLGPVAKGFAIGGVVLDDMMIMGDAIMYDFDATHHAEEPIMVMAFISNNEPKNHVRIDASIDGVRVADCAVRNEAAEQAACITFPVPAGSNWVVSASTAGGGHVEKRIYPLDMPDGVTIGAVDEVTGKFGHTIAAATDGIVVAFISNPSPQNHVRLTGYVNNDKVVYSAVRNEHAEEATSITFPVRKDETWKVEKSTSGAAGVGLFWFPLHSETKQIGKPELRNFNDNYDHIARDGLVLAYLENDKPGNHVRLSGFAPLAREVLATAVRNEAAEEATSMCFLVDHVQNVPEENSWKADEQTAGNYQGSVHWYPFEARG